MATTETPPQVHPDDTLASVVNRFPSAARAFERLGFDYCCGGASTVAGACHARGLDPDDIARTLNEGLTGDQPAPWSGMSASELSDHLLLTHHVFMRDEAERLTALTDKVVTAHGDTHPELHDIAGIWSAIAADVEPHLAKEEQVLFPMIAILENSAEPVQFPFGSIENPISVMMSEHDVLGDLLAELRSATDGYTPPADGCASYEALFAGFAEFEADTHLHMHKENNVLFAHVVELERRLG